MNHIRKLRKENGLSQQQLADKMFVNQTAVSQWELGATMPEPQAILRLADLFGVSTDYLLGRTKNLLNEEHAGSINLANIQLHSDEDFNKKKPPESEDDERQALANASDETKLALELMNRLTPENRAKAMDHLDYLLARQEGSEDTK